MLIWQKNISDLTFTNAVKLIFENYPDLVDIFLEKIEKWGEKELQELMQIIIDLNKKILEGKIPKDDHEKIVDEIRKFVKNIKVSKKINKIKEKEEREQKN